MHDVNQGLFSAATHSGRRLATVRFFATPRMSMDRPERADRTFHVSEIKQAVQEIPDDTPLVVLLATGSFNPPHKGHVSMFRHAKQYLESTGMKVIGCVLSPSSDSYVGPKCGSLGTRHFPAEQRLQMCHLIAEECGKDINLSVSSWEAEYAGGFVDFPNVARKLRDEIHEDEELKGVSVFYLAGYDLYRKCYLSRGIGTEGLGVVVAPRLHKNSVEYARNNVKNKVFAVKQADEETKSFSSTAIRAALLKGEDVSEAVGLKVAGYLKHLELGTPLTTLIEHILAKFFIF